MTKRSWQRIHAALAAAALVFEPLAAAELTRTMGQIPGNAVFQEHSLIPREVWHLRGAVGPRASVSLRFRQDAHLKGTSATTATLKQLKQKFIKLRGKSTDRPDRFDAFLTEVTYYVFDSSGKKGRKLFSEVIQDAVATLFVSDKQAVEFSKEDRDTTISAPTLTKARDPRAVQGIHPESIFKISNLISAKLNGRSAAKRQVPAPKTEPGEKPKEAATIPGPRALPPPNRVPASLKPLAPSGAAVGASQTNRPHYDFLKELVEQFGINWDGITFALAGHGYKGSGRDYVELFPSLVEKAYELGFLPKAALVTEDDGAADRRVHGPRRKSPGQDEDHLVTRRDLNELYRVITLQTPLTREKFAEALFRHTGIAQTRFEAFWAFWTAGGTLPLADLRRIHAATDIFLRPELEVAEASIPRLRVRVGNAWKDLWLGQPVYDALGLAAIVVGLHAELTLVAGAAAFDRVTVHRIGTYLRLAMLGPSIEKLDFDKARLLVAKWNKTIRKNLPIPLRKELKKGAALTEPERAAVRRKLYAITPADFARWKLQDALNAATVPFYFGNHVDALMRAFVWLDLKREGFLGVTFPEKAPDRPSTNRFLQVYFDLPDANRFAEFMVSTSA